MAKSDFTRHINHLSILLTHSPKISQVTEMVTDFMEKQDRTFAVMQELSDKYRNCGKHENAEAIENEMDTMEERAAKMQIDTSGYLATKRRSEENLSKSKSLTKVDSTKNQNSSAVHQSVIAEDCVNSSPQNEDERLISETGNEYDEADNFEVELALAQGKPPNILTSYRSSMNNSREESTSNSIGKDLWRQLQRVSIPVFSGDKLSYEGWKAAFIACVDKAPASPEYKFLQLRQYLRGEALKAVDGLDHSAEAYEIAKQRLDRKFGGERRKVGRYMAEIADFRPVREGNPHDLENFADLLDVALANLKSAGREEDLGNGMLYHQLIQKLPPSTSARYARWVFENGRKETVLVLRDWVLAESEFQTTGAEYAYGFKTRSSRHSRLNDNRTFFSGEKKKSLICPVCGNAHHIWRCQGFKKLKVDKRLDIVRNKGLCFKCLAGDHISSSCRKMGECEIDGCRKLHNRMLHEKRETHHTVQRSGETSSRVFEPITEEATMLTHRFDKIALRTVPVLLRNGNKSMQVNALLDDASTKTYINTAVVESLGITGVKQQVVVNVLNNRTETFQTMPVDVELQSVDGNTTTRLTAFTTDKVTGNMNVVNWNKHSQKWKHLQGIKFPQVGARPLVDILIGMDHADLHFSYKDVRGNPGDPIARLTSLGWTCIGNPDSTTTQETECSHFIRTFHIKHDDNLSDVLRNFWEVEEVKSQPAQIKTEDKKAIDTVMNSLSYDSYKYQVSIPWKDKRPIMPNNFKMATKRLETTERKLKKDIVVAKAYQNTITDYVNKGYVEKLSPSQVTENAGGWYLPHFPVVRPEKATTKTRVVFDASAKCDGVCLNDMIHQGPKLQKDLFDVLLRFRKHPVALVCDIKEMYLRIKIAPEDRPYHRFLWRDIDTEKPPDVYQFNTLVFGVNASPFLAQYVTQQHAERYSECYPTAAETIKKSTYMDDSMDSVENTDKAIELYQQLSELWGKASMHARKWLSNSQDVLQKIPVQDRASEVDLSKSELPNQKTLGILWIAAKDNFTFKAKDYPEEKLTKRILLSKIATLFDPLGFLAPFIIRGKMILQEIWTCGCGWDDELPDDIRKKSEIWLAEFQDLSNIEVPRSFGFDSSVQSTTLHTFVDASQEAYGAVVYVRNVHKDGEIRTHLVTAKTRVAPLTAISIPRLELMAAVLGMDLTVRASNALSLDLKTTQFWSDSMNVLWWIRGCSRNFKTFVSNRVGEIQTTTKPDQWRHVPTAENPADLLTRGISATDLTTKSLWWNGPGYLGEEELNWPTTNIPREKFYTTTAEEIKKSSMKRDCYAVVNQQTQEENWRLHPGRFSSWIRLVRIQAWVYRFLTNCRKTELDRVTGELNKEEIADSEANLIKTAQQRCFPDEYEALRKNKELPKSSKIIGLQPKLDSNETMRIDGRLAKADVMAFDAKFPIILPRKDYCTRLIVKFYHENGKHICGTNQTLAALSTKYWIVAAREAIRDWERQCAKCKLQKSQPQKQIMAPLPEVRLKMSMRAFAQTAVDYGGPFYTVQGRRRQREKRYLCLFTCFSTRAVHLEVAYGLDTDSFLNAFYRMVNRRGRPELVISDNGKNFVKAHKELKELISEHDHDKIGMSLANKGIKWKFNPPLGPHFGGAHESMIKAAKRAIYAILGNADITDEELTTAVTGAEALINSRPLTYQSANAADDIPLTPNHFLHGQIGGLFAPDSVDDTGFNPRKRWRRVQELVKHFWHRWLKEWLPGLNVRTKWNQQRRNMKVGDVVLVVEPGTSRGQWPLGRITQTMPGTDGHVRVVRVQIGENNFVRPITRLCFLEECNDISM